MVERNAGVRPEKRIDFRVGIHLGDVVEENDGDLMGDGVNIAARLESIAAPGAICLSEDAYRPVKGRVELAVSDLGLTELKNNRRAGSGLLASRRRAVSVDTCAGFRI
jgi:adenylate cyclase